MRSEMVKLSLKISFDAGCWWLLPIILATWEAELKRIMV
jgi:hypothetical protein